MSRINDNDSAAQDAAMQEADIPDATAQEGAIPKESVPDATAQEESSSESYEELLKAEQSKSKEFEEKFKRALADYRNLERRTELTIQDGISQKIDAIMRDYLDIYDNFERALEAYKAQNIDTTGLDAILKNAAALLTKNNVESIKAIGETFDASLHEAMLVTTNPDLDENTITKELRKGYIINNRVLRPALVEISKKGGDQ